MVTPLNLPDQVGQPLQARARKEHGRGVTLRRLELADAASLLALLTEDVSRFISLPPTTVEGFEEFIEWTSRRCATGQYVCFAVVPDGSDTLAGLFQIRALSPRFENAEWGFALGSAYWGTGLFLEAATEVLAFAFDHLGARRVEARAAVGNGRGNGALRKLGAVQEAVLRRSFVRCGRCFDQVLWTILREDWQAGPYSSSQGRG